MEQLPKDPPSRKKFLLWGAAILSTVTVLKFLPGGKKKKTAQPSETIKMLGQDGKLVEIDKNLFASSGKKISNEDLQKWVKR
jgi:hypothetical protein